MSQPNHLIALPSPTLDCDPFSEGEIISESNHSIPLPWVGMFRVGDLLKVSRDPKEEYPPYHSVITTMENAKRNLSASADLIRNHFPEMEPLSSYFDIMIEELTQFPQPFVGIEAMNFCEWDSCKMWEDELIGFDDLAEASARIPLTLKEKIMARFGHPPRKHWKPNGFDQKSLLIDLPHADFRRLNLPATDEQLTKNARLLPGRIDGSPVWMNL